MTYATQAITDMPTIRQTQLLIDGKWRDSVSCKTFTTICPTTEEKITEVAEGDAADIDLAAKAGRRAFESGPWSKMDGRERGRLISRLADLVEENVDELAALETLDNGMPINDSRGVSVALTVQCLRYYAGWADKIDGTVIPIPGNYLTYTRPEPIGVAGLIIPWNFPLYLAAVKLGPALAVGCTVVLKPAEQTPLSALRLGELAMEAGFPPGVINIVNGFGPTAGAALVSHPDVAKISFTGECRTGQIIMKNAADSLKRVTLELGGKCPNVVFADADLEAAVEGAYFGLFFSQGQVCCAGSRVFVEETVHEEFMSRMIEKARNRRLGNPFDPNTEQGPQVDRNQFDKIMRYIDLGKEQGAACLTGGHRAFEKGYFIQPTVFDGVKDDMAIATDEIFGPVMSVLTFKDVAEAVKRANDTPYGLAAAVWTRDVAKAHTLAHSMQAGVVWINCYDVLDPSMPFGGYKMSGIGRELGEAALANYIQTKTITVSLESEKVS